MEAVENIPPITPGGRAPVSISNDKEIGSCNIPSSNVTASSTRKANVDPAAIPLPRFTTISVLVGVVGPPPPMSAESLAVSVCSWPLGV